jgi:hypothetical protein
MFAPDQAVQISTAMAFLQAFVDVIRGLWVRITPSADVNAAEPVSVLHGGHSRWRAEMQGMRLSVVCHPGIFSS